MTQLLCGLALKLGGGVQYNYRHSYVGYCVLILAMFIVLEHALTSFFLVKLNFMVAPFCFPRIGLGNLPQS